MKDKIWIYIKSILIPVIIGGVVGFIINKFIDYNDLVKPPFAPPSFIFPVMWSVLYILMGISYGILKSNNKVDTNINIIYYLQLGVNALWSIFFFILKIRLFSIIWILLLIITIILMITKFYSKSKLSSYLQIPYLIWTLFATYLNIGIYLLN